MKININKITIGAVFLSLILTSSLANINKSVIVKALINQSSSSSSSSNSTVLSSNTSLSTVSTSATSSTNGTLSSSNSQQIIQQSSILDNQSISSQSTLSSSSSQIILDSSHSYSSTQPNLSSQSTTISSELYEESLPNTIIEDSGPNNGDSNNDGTQDSAQSNVATIPSFLANGDHITLQLSPISGSDSTCTSIKGATNYQPNSIANDNNYGFPIGVVNFGTSCTGSVNVKIYWHGISDIAAENLVIRKYSGTQNTPGGWVTPAFGFVNSYETIGGLQVATTSYTLTDGGSNDNSSTQGLIVDPIGLGYAVNPVISTTSSSTTYNSANYGNNPNTSIFPYIENLTGNYVYCYKQGYFGGNIATMYKESAKYYTTQNNRAYYKVIQNNAANIQNGSCVGETKTIFVPEVQRLNDISYSPLTSTMFDLDSGGNPINVKMLSYKPRALYAFCSNNQLSIKFASGSDTNYMLGPITGLTDFMSNITSSGLEKTVSFAKNNPSFVGYNDISIETTSNLPNIDLAYGVNSVVLGQAVSEFERFDQYPNIFPNYPINNKFGTRIYSTCDENNYSAPGCARLFDISYIPGASSNISSQSSNNSSKSSFGSYLTGCSPQFYNSSSQSNTFGSSSISFCSTLTNLFNQSSTSTNSNQGICAVNYSTNSSNSSSISSAAVGQTTGISSSYSLSNLSSVITQSSNATSNQSLSSSSQLPSVSSSSRSSQSQNIVSAATTANSSVSSLSSSSSQATLPILPSVNIEDQAPNNGDGNGDGIKDSLQDNVISIPTSSGNSYTTMVLSGDGECSRGHIIKNISANSLPIDINRTYPFGLVDFTIKCSGTSNVKMYWHGISNIELDGYEVRKNGNITPSSKKRYEYYKAKTINSTETIGGKQVAVSSYSLTDGQAGDDTIADGYIIDPIGLAKIEIVPTSGSSVEMRNLTLNSNQQTSNPATISTNQNNPIQTTNAALVPAFVSSKNIELENEPYKPLPQTSGKGITTRTGGYSSNLDDINVLISLVSLFALIISCYKTSQKRLPKQSSKQSSKLETKQLLQ